MGRTCLTGQNNGDLDVASGKNKKNKPKEMKGSIRQDEVEPDKKDESIKKEEEQEKLDRDESEEETPGEWPGFGEPKD